MKMRQRVIILCASLLILLSACSKPRSEAIAVCPVLPRSEAVPADPCDPFDETEAAVCVEWVDFVSHDGHIYESDMPRRTVNIFKIGAKLGEVTLNPLSYMSGEEWDEWQREKRTLTQGCASFLPVGSEFYAVKGDERSIAVKADGKYYLYTRSD